MQSMAELMRTYQASVGANNDKEKSLESLGLREDEYTLGDNIYCNKCNTPRTTHIELLGVPKIVRCICKCEKEELDKKEKERVLQERLLRLAKLQENSLMGLKYQNVNFNNTIISQNDSFYQAYQRCKKYCENYEITVKEGMGIYIFGNSGVGKTRLTACMANDLLKKGVQVIFTNFFEISKAIRNTYNSGVADTEGKLLHRLNTVDVLFLDDLGTESLAKNDGNNFLQDKIFEIINARYNNNKSTIFTSNYSMNQLVSERGVMAKTVDRIFEMSTAKLEIKGTSYRQQAKSNIEIPF